MAEFKLQQLPLLEDMDGGREEGELMFRMFIRMTTMISMKKYDLEDQPHAVGLWPIPTPPNQRGKGKSNAPASRKFNQIFQII